MDSKASFALNEGQEKSYETGCLNYDDPRMS